MSLVLHYVWYGIWTGVGFEISFGALWALNRLVHSKFAKDLDPSHWLHAIHEYFD